MPTTAELTARSIVDANLYLVIATANGIARPWSSPLPESSDRHPRKHAWRISNGRL